MNTHTCTTERHPEPCASCYANCGCRCDGCKVDRNRQMKVRRHKLATGYRENIPVEPVARHVDHLRRTMSVTQIAKEAGVYHDAVRRVTLRAHPTISRRMAARLLAVNPVPITAQDTGLVDGAGTRRRLQALHAIGWTSAGIAREIGMDVREVWRYLSADHVSAASRAAIARGYDRLWDRKPPEADRYQHQAVVRAQNTAKRRKWALPLAWDDGYGPHGIDNPNATPYTDIREGERETIAEKVEWLLDGGLRLPAILARLDTNRDTLYRALDRVHRRDLWQRLTREEAA